jgi:hypothetical protein
VIRVQSKRHEVLADRLAWRRAAVVWPRREHESEASCRSPGGTVQTVQYRHVEGSCDGAGSAHFRGL